MEKFLTDITQAVEEHDQRTEQIKNHEGLGGIYILTSWKPSRVPGQLQIASRESVQYLKFHPKSDVVTVRLKNGGQAGDVQLRNLTLCTDPEEIQAFREACKDPFKVNERVILTDAGREYVFEYLLKDVFVLEATLKTLLSNAMSEGKGFKVIRVLGNAISIEVVLSLPGADLKTNKDKKRYRIPIGFDAVSYLVAKRIKRPDLS